MKKFKKIFMLLFAITICIVAINMITQKGTISIYNNSNIDVTNIELCYSEQDFIKLPTIKSKDTYNTNINLPKNFSEGFIKISYRNTLNELQEIYLENYIEHSYKKDISITINSIDNTGILNIDYSIN